MIDAAVIEELVKWSNLELRIYNELLKLYVTVISSKLLHTLLFATILRNTGVLLVEKEGNH